MDKKYRINKKQDRLELKSLKEDFKDKKNRYSILQKQKSIKFKERSINVSKLDTRVKSYEYNAPERNLSEDYTEENLYKNINSKNNIPIEKSLIDNSSNYNDYQYSSKKGKLSKNKNKIDYINSKKKLNSKKEDSLVSVPKLNKLDEKISSAKKDLDNSRKSYKIKKKQYNKKYKGKVKDSALATASQIKTHSANAVLSQDEDLSKYTQAKQEYASKKYIAGKSIRIGKFTVTKSSKILYGGINRTYNKVQGRGFTRTPKEFSFYNKTRNKVINNKRVQQLKKLRQKTKRYTRWLEILVKNIFKNPFKLTGLTSLLIVLFFISLFMSSISPAQMNESNMTDTWTYFTKLDKENSTEKVNYNSNIEDYIFYINYRYDKILKEIYTNDNVFAKNNEYNLEKNKDKSLSETSEGRDYLEKMWDYLNKDYNSLKTIDDLILNSEEFKLDEKELKEYKELLKISNQIGKFPYAQELDNFLYEKKDSNYKKPLRILERFGYRSEDELVETTTFVTEENQYLYAPITGKVTIDGSNVSIEQGSKKITFYNIQSIRVISGNQVLRNEIIGNVATGTKQEVRYEKLIKGNWKPVNIGFYLPKVEYVEKTYVKKDFNLDKDKSARIDKFVEVVKKYIPNATNEGLAAVLGNFDIESGINPKRAEGDYLPPPIGVVDESSWDNPEWLDIGGVAIYNGRYPNIIRRGLGLGQWTDTMDGAVRHTLLRNFAKEKNMSWYDLELQVDFIINGDSPFYRQQFIDIVTSSDDVAVLTKRFLNNWEGNPSDKLDNRIAHARSYLDYFSRPKSEKLDIDGTFNEDVALEVVAELNAHRRAHGLSEVTINRYYDDGAEVRAQEFSILARRGYNDPMELHKRLDGSNWHTAFPPGVLAENVSFAYNGTAGMMGFWKNSPSHNAAMLNPAHTRVTVKVFYTDGQYYGVQIFS